MHEAVVRLASEGFVEALPRRGVRVVHLTPRDIAEIFELREALEAEMVRLVLTRAPADSLEALQSSVVAGDAALAAHGRLVAAGACTGLERANHEGQCALVPWS